MARCWECKESALRRVLADLAWAPFLVDYNARRRGSREVGSLIGECKESALRHFFFDVVWVPYSFE